MGPCGKAAVAKYYYRAVSNIPKYVCEIHDKEILKNGIARRFRKGRRKCLERK